MAAPPPATRLAHLTTIALALHATHVDKHGAPYSEHLLEVTAGVSDAAKPVALFHDTLENHKATAAELAEYLTPDELAAVELLSRDKALDDYAEYIERLRVAPGYPGELAREVKRSDLRHNYGRLTPELEYLRPRYVAAFKALRVPSRLDAGFVEALAFMFEHHGDLSRRGGLGVPEVAHLMSVSALVMEHGGEQEDAIAALLHDTIEDVDLPDIEAQIAERFGPEVARIVRDVSDTDETPKPPWRARKEQYIAHLAQVDERALRVSAADKLHNVRSLLADYRSVGDRLWTRFPAGRDAQLWVYGAYAAAFRERLAELGRESSPTAELVALLDNELVRLNEAVDNSAP